MEPLIVYATKYGSTARYAELLAQECHVKAYDTKQAPEPKNNQPVIALGDIHFSRLGIASWLNKVSVSGPLAVVAVCGFPKNADLKTELQKQLPNSQYRLFLLSGAIDTKRLTFFDRLVVWFLKKNESGKAKERLESGFDDVDKKRLKPILDWLQKM